MQRFFGWSQLCILLAALLLLGACAIGNKHAYHDVVGSMPFSGNAEVRVATHDQRPYVLSGEKQPDFVGLSRGGYGNPFDVSTADGRPLADGMTQAISNSLRQGGFRPAPVIVASSDSAAQAREKLMQAAGGVAILLVIREWKSDTYQNTALHYDATLSVLDKTGQVLGETTVRGRDNLGGSFANPPAHAREAVPRAFKAKLEALLGDPAVTRALGGSR